MDREAWLGYNPWGHKDLDTAEVTGHAHRDIGQALLQGYVQLLLENVILSMSKLKIFYVY